MAWLTRATRQLRIGVRATWALRVRVADGISSRRLSTDDDARLTKTTHGARVSTGRSSDDGRRRLDDGRRRLDDGRRWLDDGGYLAVD
uniref:Uncharacterized protein n=1 Tax=Cucumis melo TaxID=3656 RepID=A0A9I9CUY7_CUCME